MQTDMDKEMCVCVQRGMCIGTGGGCPHLWDREAQHSESPMAVSLLSMQTLVSGDHAPLRRTPLRRTVVRDDDEPGASC